MTWTPRAARAVVGAATLCALGGVGLLAGTGAAAAADAVATEPTTAAREVSALPQSFSFTGMSPGQTRSTIVDLTSTHATDGSVVGVRVTTSGELGPSLSTSIEACGAAWTSEGCATGAVVLIDGWRDEQSGSSLEELALPAGATASLRVSVTLDHDVRAGATGSVRYDISLAETPPGETGGGASDPSGADGATGAGTPSGPWDGGLAATGTTALTLAGLAGALLGIGVALVRRRRRDESGAAGGPRRTITSTER